MKQKQPRSAGAISEAAVQEATGKGWDAWYAILDRFDVRANGHAAAARHLHERHGCSGWWSQMVTVAYEQARGLREKHQKPGGYTAGGSRTIAVPLGRLFRAWKDSRERRRWLPEGNFTIRKATPGKSMRITWIDGRTHLDVTFYARGAAKSQVALQHSKLAGAKDSARMKRYWSGALDRLRCHIEGRS